MKLSDVEKLMANRLSTQVTFLPGSYDKRFCNSLAPDADYTEKRINFIYTCFHRYRRQIKDYQEIAKQIPITKVLR